MKKNFWGSLFFLWYSCSVNLVFCPFTHSSEPQKWKKPIEIKRKTRPPVFWHFIYCICRRNLLSRMFLPWKSSFISLLLWPALCKQFLIKSLLWSLSGAQVLQPPLSHGHLHLDHVKTQHVCSMSTAEFPSVQPSISTVPFSTLPWLETANSLQNYPSVSWSYCFFEKPLASSCSRRLHSTCSSTSYMWTVIFLSGLLGACVFLFQSVLLLPP